MIHYLIIGLVGFVNNFNGPGVQITCPAIEEFIGVYGFRPYDLDGDGDVDLADFAKFQNGFDGKEYLMDVTAVLERNKEMEVAAAYSKLKEIIESCAGDIAKFESGNKAAGTRVRKAMQEVKAQAQAVRQSVLKKRDD